MNVELQMEQDTINFERVQATLNDVSQLVFPGGTIS